MTGSKKYKIIYETPHNPNPTSFPGPHSPGGPGAYPEKENRKGWEVIKEIHEFIKETKGMLYYDGLDFNNIQIDEDLRTLMVLKFGHVKGFRVEEIE